MTHHDRPEVTADTRDLFDAALIAPLVVPFVLPFVVMALGEARGGVVGGFISTFVLGMFLGLPVAYVVTVAVALPVVLLWRRVFRSINLFSILALGAVLGLSPLVVVAMPAMLGVGFTRLAAELPSLILNATCLTFSLCGVATAAAFWWVGLRGGKTRAPSAVPARRLRSRPPASATSAPPRPDA